MPAGTECERGCGLTGGAKARTARGMTQLTSLNRPLDIRMRWMVYICWFCLCLFLTGLVPAANHLALTLKRIDSRPGMAGFEIGDIDGDGRIEEIELSADHCRFWAREFSREMVVGPAIYQVTSEYWINSVKPIEVDTTPGMELAIAYKDQLADSAWLCIIAGADKERVLCRTEAIHGVNLNDRDTKINPKWDGSIAQCFAVDLNNDGVREIVISVNTAFDLYPRGLYVYQYPSGRLLWRFPTAGNLSSVVFGDATGDGYTEIFLKTSASANGAIVGDQSDTTADIFALDYAGRQLWRMGTKDRFEFHTCNIEVGDYDGDSIMEIYYGMLLRADDFDRQVQVLEKHRAADNLFLQQHSFDAGHRFQQLIVGPIDGDSTPKLILNNGPTVLDPRNLATISEGPYLQGDIAYIGDFERITPMPSNAYVGNLGRGATTHAMIIRNRDSLHIVDGNFRLLTAYGAEYGRNIDAVRYFHSPVGGDYLGILVDAGDAEKPGNILYVLEVVPAGTEVISDWWTSGQVPWAVVFVAFLLGIPAGVVLLLLVTRKPRPDINHSAAYEDMLLALTAFGHGQAAGRNLTRLAFLFSNLPEAPKKVVEILPNVQSAVETYRSFTAEQLGTIAGNGRRIPDLRPVIDELATHTKQLHIFLSVSTPRQTSIDDLIRLKVVVPRTIESIRQVIKKLESQIQPAFGSDLIEVIPAVLISSAGSIRRHNVRISQVIMVGDYRHLVFFPPAELAVVIDELITNACRAMKDAATRNLSLRLEFTVDQVIIDVIDTGTGVEVDDPEILFSREFSTKGEEGGFGLFHARQRIEHFGGKIRIHNNADGPGATVRMVFKGISRE
jgi:signal transduction histidine kinase